MQNQARLDEAAKSIGEFLGERWPRYDLPGLAVALTNRDETYWVGRYGYANVEAGTPITPGTLFQTGSIGKSFTSIALLQEREAGGLDLQNAVTAYLPWFEVRSAYPPITVHHLLSHTAGIARGIDFSPDSRSQVWALRETDTAWPPGEHFHYSNDGYKALGLVLQELTGRSYAETVRSRILEPLGMQVTHPTISLDTFHDLTVGYGPFYDDRPWRHGSPRAPVPRFETDTADGCLASSLEDMTIYLRMLLNRGSFPGGRLLCPESFELLTQHAIILPGRGGWAWYGYGLFGLEEDGHTVIGHSGGMPGFVSEIVGDLDAGVGVVWLVNSGTGGVPAADREHVLRLARAAVEETLPPEAPAPFDATLVPDAEAYTGTYTGAETSFTLTPDGKRLLMHWHDTPIPLEPRGEGAFLVAHPAFSLFLLRVAREGEEVLGASYGPAWFSYGGKTVKRDTEIPATWSAYPGHYRAFNPWLPGFRVFERHGGLLLVFPSGTELRLNPSGEARFTLGPDEPGYLAFGPIVEGQAIAAMLTGGMYYRVNAP